MIGFRSKLEYFCLHLFNLFLGVLGGCVCGVCEELVGVEAPQFMSRRSLAVALLVPCWWWAVRQNSQVRKCRSTILAYVSTERCLSYHIKDIYYTCKLIFEYVSALYMTRFQLILPFPNQKPPNFKVAIEW